MKKINLPILNSDELKTAFVKTAGGLVRPAKSPDEALGPLFSDVQTKRVFGDGKTFADLVPKRRMKHIQQEYVLARDDPQFDLREFVSRHFYEFTPGNKQYVTDKNMDVRTHIRELWHVLERKNRRDRGSLLALPYAYIVPGGRFSEQFYWDSYFIMLGLAADERWDTLEGMLKNFAYMIRKFGYIPTANRTYFLSRSQPPFFSQMVKLLAKHKGNSVLAEYLPYMVLEYRFWMKGHSKLADREHKALGRVVQMPNGSLLNRYYDNKSTPRPESLSEDEITATSAPNRMANRLYLHLRAGAESGWDFSSRWFMQKNDIHTIHAADIIPVDLNSLLYMLETTIADSYSYIKQPQLARKFYDQADQRKRAIGQYCWNETGRYFDDYNFHHGISMERPSLAMVFPLYAKCATSSQAAEVARKIERFFLKDGGLTATLTNTGQQWDAPNGWAPLHWVAIQGLRNYGYNRLADTIKQRWTTTNLRTYQASGKLVEKYDVVNPSQAGGGGEYPLQDGFGWTNGVLAALLEEDEKK